MNVLDLFSGIGGFSLGLERAGMRTAAFCEIEPFCRAVLKRHWPTVPIYDDIRELSGRKLWDDGNTVSIQVICGGFPCQDISAAGLGAGIDGERSGLWSDFARLIGDLRPRYAIVENSPALKAKGRGLDRVLGDLATLGYDAWWDCIPASALGAAIPRDRIWIVACPAEARPDQGISASRQPLWHETWRAEFERYRRAPGRSERLSESGIPRIADGLPNQSHRVGAIGNAIYVKTAEIIGRAILAHEENRARGAID